MAIKRTEIWHVTSDQASVDHAVTEFCEEQKMAVQRQDGQTYLLERGSEALGVLMGKVLEPQSMLPLSGSITTMSEGADTTVVVTLTAAVRGSVLSSRIESRYADLFDALISAFGKNLAAVPV